MILHDLYVHIEHLQLFWIQCKNCKRCMIFPQDKQCAAAQPRSPHCSTLDSPYLNTVCLCLDEIQQGSPQPQLFPSPKGQPHHFT